MVIGLTTVIAQDRLGQPPAPARATLIAQAARYHARIQRDHFGVPHISGATDADVAFGLGYAHSEDDFATIQDAALTARGQLAAVEGAKGAVTDYLVRLLKVRETVAAQYDTALPPMFARCWRPMPTGSITMPPCTRRRSRRACCR